MQGLLLTALASTAAAYPASNFLMPNVFMPFPLDDSFYDAPSGLDQMASGQVYNSRQVDPDFEGKLTMAHVSQIAYKTEDTYSNSTHSIATIFEPLIPASSAKLLSYQVWEDSAELNCSPSYSLVKGLLSPDTLTTSLDTAATIEFALLNGWHVVVPDHEGLTSAFIEGYIQGHVGLDGIRAAISYLGFDANTPTAMYGYSGGASATVWMTNLHESYAPEINVVGAAHGGTPVDITHTVNWLDRADNMFSGFFVAALAGLLNGYPGVKERLWSHFTPKLQSALTELFTPNNCIVTELLAMGHTEWHTEMDFDFWTNPDVAYVVARESLFKNVGTGIVSVPKFPRYIFHAENDEIITFGAVEKYVQEQCAEGANIQWVPWKGDDHLSVEYIGLPDVFQFLQQAFDGTLEQFKCGTAPSDVLTLASTTMGDALGQVAADFISIANGLTTPFGKISFDPNQGR